MDSQYSEKLFLENLRKHFGRGPLTKAMPFVPLTRWQRFKISVRNARERFALFVAPWLKE